MKYKVKPNIRKDLVVYDKVRKYQKDYCSKPDFLKLDPTVLNRCKSFDVTRHVAKYHPNELLIGIELELESASGNRSNTIQTINTHFPHLVRCVSDGSLDYGNGIEINTLPHSVREYKDSRIHWHKLLQSLSMSGCTSHNNERCGLHVHINRQYMTDEQWLFCEKFILKNKKEFMTISRRKTYNYCQFKQQSRRGVIHTYGNRYSALNMGVYTAEFRYFRGTLLPQSFLASVESVILLCQYIKTNPKTVSYRKFHKWLTENTKGLNFGTVLLQSVTPTPKQVKELTEQEKQDRAIQRQQRKLERVIILQREINLLVYGSSSPAVPDNTLWVYRASNRYACTYGQESVELYQIPVTFSGRIKEQIRKTPLMVGINIIKPKSAPYPTELRIHKSQGWGSSRISRYLTTSHSYDCYTQVA